MHLAQVNIARMLAPLTDPLMAGFVARLQDINALADRSPGFVWRLQTDEGDATALRADDDDRTLLNMSVWHGIEELRAFVYASAHVEPTRQRRSWFERSDGPVAALWWVPVGPVPPLGEGVERLGHLRAHGPTAVAFTFRKPFPASDA